MGLTPAPRPGIKWSTSKRSVRFEKRSPRGGSIDIEIGEVVNRDGFVCCDVVAAD